ncbi:hypothetical protein BS1321_25645 [Peribacillus simplex NBRC 15720 = DSM 1321]|uniref:Putative sugar diacid recognition domain-containing protein n=1 Tax=Peribacillus simplex NBRC 15720 = DSM 1321 TaxID=1349754 RepID=A0A223EP31_9BACI|nr:sugar diacid recognition domain-containing protein [Peribacillus simplex]ASS96986.1 hypothetical protein BS1321_25645 [Peribacillus simplex NBRC 15720 = DSM 1321]MEC1398675.1 sugar diacid recognition domain-containing protein [Peribacillus simplex]
MSNKPPIDLTEILILWMIKEPSSLPNRERIDQLHFGAMEVLKTGKPLIIHEKDRHQWAGVLPGINLPINFQNVIIGVIGITGDPTELLEFGELVKMITEMMLHQALMAEQLEWKQHLK